MYTEIPPSSAGVDYRDLMCTAPATTSIDQLQLQLAPVSAAVNKPALPLPLPSPGSSLALPVPVTSPALQQPPPIFPPPSPPAPPAPTPQIGDMVLRGMQSPLAGLAKLLGQYNLFG